MNNQRTLIGLAGLAMVIGFFMPWIDIAGLGGGVSGWDIVSSEHVEWSTRIILALCPIAGVMLVLTGFGKSQSANTLALVSGTGILGYTFFKLAYAFVKVSGVGLWLVLGAGAIALIFGLAGRGGSSKAS